MPSDSDIALGAKLIDDELTPLSAGAVCRAFFDAFTKLMGAEPKPRALAILMAQSALESGRWKSLHCFNFTNIKASETYEGFYCLYRCNEIIKGKVEWFDPPHAQCRFRAFKSAAIGAIDYLAFLQRARYKPAWDQAIAGDPVAFVGALKRGGFFTASEEPYRRAVVSLTNEYLMNIAGWLGEELNQEPGIQKIDVDHELRVLATEAATEARFVMLDDLRQSAHREMSDLDDEEDTVVTEPPREA